MRVYLREAISKGLLVIEWFPYHLKRSALPIKPVCPFGQDGSGYFLTKEMLGSKNVVGMRSKKHWLNVIPAVGELTLPEESPEPPHQSRQHRHRFV